MVYEVFLETIRQKLQQDFGSDYRLDIHSVPKNNGVTLDGLSIFAPGSRMAPTVYLNPYYEQFQQQRMNLDEICADIKRLFSSNPLPSSIRVDQLMDFEKMRSKIMMKLIHTASNKELLADVPHIPYLDLAIVFYLFLEHNETGQMTALIHHNHASAWKVSERDLLHLAMDNTPLCFPSKIRSMTELLKDIARQNLDNAPDENILDCLFAEHDQTSPLYILTNESGIYGAVCMLYRNVLKNFANLLNRDLIIIPSSVHEVLLTPLEEEISYEDLNSMVININQTEVPPEDQLSNHVYRYDRKSDRISIVLSETSGNIH